ncbi:MAG TPA: S-methyl-5-thioribose-1-phosphate isomerase [Clostridiaceae bacterium]|nr:S-methyl-5-thioribose-1-phosphate isomerase [Clostridiaceae bacterium]
MYALKWFGSELSLLDQTLLPTEEVYRHYDSVEGVYDAIRNMVVRGAPAIGVAAAYGMVLAARTGPPGEGFLPNLESSADYLISARPTAVNLPWAVERMLATAREFSAENIKAYKGARYDALISRLEQEAILIHEEDKATSKNIGENSLSLLKPGDGVLTHCNAGALATTGSGTALAPFYLALERGFPLKIYVDETRPRLQGARLTAFELDRAGADITLICDNMAATVMSQGKIQACITGADRIAANGDTANKVGTLGVAILASYFDIPFYIAAPTSTIDPSSQRGQDILIEEREADEIRHINGSLICPPDVPVYNPGFDVTPAELITAIITEKGIIRPPYDADIM